MRGACPSIFKACTISKPSLSVASVIAWASILNMGLPVCAQLPQTNMGQFVHQPGDNQYTSQIQSERHGPAPSPMVPVVSAPPAFANSSYTPTPAAPKPDISLLPIVADEPIKPAGFPPLPDRLDLPANGSGVWSGAGQRINDSDANGASGTGIDRNPTGVHQHYIHYNSGAFMPNSAAPQNNYRPNSADYYNINPNARANMAAPINAIAAPPVDTPSEQALKRMGPEPQLAGDAVTRPEAPTAVTVNQSVSQDLSLPEDDFNKHYPTNIGNSSGNRAAKGVARTLAYPLRSVLYTGASMATYGAMYAVRR